MKFKQYITEKEDLKEEYDNLVKSIQKYCQPFLKEFKDVNNLIFRGYKKGISRPLFQRKPTRKDRKPRFIPLTAHNDLDNYLKKTFGWKARSEGVFTADDYKAGFFANDNIFIFIPVGKYEYIWTDGRQRDNIYNLYDDLTIYHGKDGYGNEFEYERIIDDIEVIYGNFYSNKGLSNYLKKPNVEFEAIFKCDSFYLIDRKSIVVDNWKYGVDELLINDLF